MTSRLLSLAKFILITIGWFNVCPVIILGWRAIGGEPILEMQLVGALVVSIVGFIMLFILYTPVEEDNHGRR